MSNSQQLEIITQHNGQLQVAQQQLQKQQYNVSNLELNVRFLELRRKGQAEQMQHMQNMQQTLKEAVAAMWGRCTW